MKRKEDKMNRKKMLESVVIDATKDIQWNRSTVYYNEANDQTQIQGQSAAPEELQRAEYEEWQKHQWKQWQEFQKARSIRAAQFRNKPSVRNIIYPPEHSTEAQTSLLEYQRHAFKLLQRYLDTAVLFDELESMSTLEENGNEKEESLQGEEEKEDGVLREEDLLAGFKLFRSSSIESAREHRKKREKEAKAKKKKKRKEESDSDEEDKRLEMLRAAVIDVPQTKWLSNGPEVVDKKKERQMNVDLLVGKVISSKAVEPNAAVKKSTSLPSLLVPTPTPTAKTSTENGKENEDTKKKKKKKSKRKEDKASETKETKKKGTKRKKSEETSTTEAAADGDREKKKRKLGGDHNPLALLTKKAKKRVKTKPKAA